MNDSPRLPLDDVDEPKHKPHDHSHKKEDKNQINNEKIDDIQLQRIRWKNRRRMAWISLLSMIVVTAILLTSLIPESRVSVLSDVITWFYFSMASVIGFYMGATTWAAVKKA